VTSQRTTAIIGGVERRRDERDVESPMALLKDLPALVVLERFSGARAGHRGGLAPSSSRTTHLPRCWGTQPTPLRR